MRLESAAISRWILFHRCLAISNLKYRSAKLVAKALGPNSTEAQFRKEELSERKVVKMLRMLGSNINPLPQGVGSSERRMFGVFAQLWI